jgi:small-conductance mechanosensitive channel
MAEPKEYTDVACKKMKKFLKIYIVYIVVTIAVLYILPPVTDMQFDNFKRWFLAILQKPETQQYTVNFSVLIIAIAIITNVYFTIKEHQKNEK